MSHDLTSLADELAKGRDAAIADGEAAHTSEGREFAVGKAVGLRYALGLLHVYTDGDYGVDDRDQPDPYALPPLAPYMPPSLARRQDDAS